MKKKKSDKEWADDIKKLEFENLKNWYWPFLRINSNGAKEYACPHGVGHGGIHGCDGCCRHKSFPRGK